MKTIARKNWDETTSTGDVVVHKNDIWLENGQFAIASGTDCYAQTIEAVIKTIRGEMPLSTEKGIPYFLTVFLGNGRGDAWASVVRKEVLALSFVNEIKAFEYSYDFTKKKFIYTLTVSTDSGETTVSNE